MNNKGLTLVEIMVAALIFSLIIGGLYSVFAVGNTTYVTDTTLTDLMEQQRNAFDRMVRELRASSSIVHTVLTSTNHKIAFNTPKAINVQYYKDSSNRLVREYPAGTTQFIAYQINELTFSPSGSLLTVQLKSNQTVMGRNLSVAMKGNVRLRND